MNKRLLRLIKNYEYCFSQDDICKLTIKSKKSKVIRRGILNFSDELIPPKTAQNEIIKLADSAT